jgi:hypothetical protein
MTPVCDATLNTGTSRQIYPYFLVQSPGHGAKEKEMIVISIGCVN